MARGRQSPEVDYKAAAQWPEARQWLRDNAPPWVVGAVQHMHNNLVTAVQKFRDNAAQAQVAVVAERREKKKVQAQLSRGTVEAFTHDEGNE